MQTSKAIKHNPNQRKSVVTGTICSRQTMIRFVISPQHYLIADLAEKLPGRGLWVEAERMQLIKGIKQGKFSRAARTSIYLDSEMTADAFADQVENNLKNRVLHYLSLARRAGQVVVGESNIKTWLTKHPILNHQDDCKIVEDSALSDMFEKANVKTISRLWLIASDAGKDIQKNTSFHADQARFDEHYVTLLTGEELGQVFSKARCVRLLVHQSPQQGGLMERLQIELERLAGFRHQELAI